MHRLFAIIIILWPAFLKAQDSYQEKVTSACNMGLTIANNGLIGNCFKGNYLLNNGKTIINIRIERSKFYHSFGLFYRLENYVMILIR